MTGGNEQLHGGDKLFHDELFGRIPANIAESRNDNALMRAIFYLEVGRITNAPLGMSSSKTEVLNELEQVCKNTLHESIVRLTSEPLKEKWNNLLSKGESVVLRLNSPPIIAMILQKSLFEKKSLVESAYEIRDSREAKEYRKWLHELHQKQLNSSMSGNRNQYYQELEKLKGVAEEWSSHNDVRHLVDYKIRKINLSRLPHIGWIMSVFSTIHPFVIKDPILNTPPGYLAFISSWYR
ncbi:MAG: hypothetical protein AB4368_16165 [Xenococcaceae cyanobacterium]